jgi:hypothetical protein
VEAGPVVGDEVTITIDAEAIKDQTKEQAEAATGATEEKKQ